MAKRIYLSSPTMHGEELQFVNEAFDTNWVAPLGPHVNAFEKELAAYVNTGHAAALSAGTAAIHLALKLAGVKAGDTVFASTLTFSATCNPICYEGAKPVFIDAEPDTWNMSPDALRRAFEKYPQTKVVIVANLYGVPAKLNEILEICEEYGAILIEDAAESLGATYKGKQTGTFGKYGIFSFNGNKIITTSGGGMLVSESEEDMNKSRFLATQAREPERHYEHKEIGYNYRMSNVLAGIGRGQLLHLDEHIAKKKAIYMAYKDAFAEIPAITMNPYDESCMEPNYWLSCITIDADSSVNPLDIMVLLEKENIESRPIWKPMHLQPVFADCDYFSHYEDGSSVSEDVFNRGVCLPSDIKNTPEEMAKIIEMIKGLFA
ncbi:MAG: aminotransferase class I/II-fold pyridoxal phosphate-dependent enzyme [Lachnospiraceae bacterium]|nr:aminotransferase class I/II-fold pyridoxal phosphate-dependent enzyme [Lachnospiraceae bacterium]